MCVGWEGDNQFDFGVHCSHSPLPDQRIDITHFLMKMIWFFKKKIKVHRLLLPDSTTNRAVESSYKIRGKITANQITRALHIEAVLRIISVVTGIRMSKSETMELLMSF